MNSNESSKSQKTHKSLRKAEAIFILLFLCIGAWTTFSFFRGAHNPNDMSFAGIPNLVGFSDNLFQITCWIKNFSNVPLRSFSVVGDSYDRDGRIIGTNSFISDMEAVLSPSDTLRIAMKIEVLSGCENVGSVMLIPRSQFGTGKILVHSVK
jgi:hypothetical protein